MAILPKTYEALGKLAAACGLDRQRVSKLVISCAVDEPIRFYVVGYIDQEQLNDVADAIEVLSCQDVQVADDGTIHADESRVVKPYRGREFI